MQGRVFIFFLSGKKCDSPHLLLLSPFQHLIEFALAGGRGREEGTVFF
jgi:hypothetical protein